MIRFLWWLLPDSNWGHKALQASALPTELKSHAFSKNLCYFTVFICHFQSVRVFIGYMCCTTSCEVPLLGPDFCRSVLERFI